MAYMMRQVMFSAVLVSGGMVALAGSQSTPTPKRINKAIELLEQGQPIYYTQVNRGGYDEGLALAQTYADYITYNLEHSAFDIASLEGFMRGLVEGGPTKSGHRTPTVICVLPVRGLDGPTMRANGWMVEQVLSAGVHGVLLVHARSPDAARAMVEAARFPRRAEAATVGLAEGLRGSGAQGNAARIWGISSTEYLEVADPWPLNPDGEILLGLKIEDRHALENAEALTKVPGIGFAEWGPGDMAMSFGLSRNADGAWPAVLAAARARVLNATKAAGIPFLNAVTPDNVEAMIDGGVMIGAANEAAAERGRRHTGRTMPW
ncbi:MAG: aldolase/citrate lyase family protein [Vicinamibacterales bacterium]|jgi:4-hydroxy-2-oxoheptanedioate aldolase|nr:aldolase/citrate lyase family protein [Vicinamibacterales bacterium]MDP6608344.1 aldolase/citrate lyase family protein [Vicinamibacterales bacterium]MDP7473009.1 aldolase/citrate lyase family protein [Vicinamibacterales bacterium]MDP7671699.1 aldolase/citrate lyase family protein [Vicinamibacterales bacterium]HJO39150.1 aldolase/citrate lyase family protein [Vicinamibacterales bacterium]|tara:strand:- start:184 stop:1143 length:960 start_codon:yes stop_codon:yes gene_type:complete